DYDEDGYQDIAKTNFSDDIPNLYHNMRDGTFADQALKAGLGARPQYLGWGVHFLDADHDGRKDLLIVNGHIYPAVDRTSLPVIYRQEPLLYWNVGGGTFHDLPNSSGPGITAAWSRRGSAAGELDNDGSLELVVINMGERPTLLKNFGPHKNWLL